MNTRINFRCICSLLAICICLIIFASNASCRTAVTLSNLSDLSKIKNEFRYENEQKELNQILSGIRDKLEAAPVKNRPFVLRQLCAKSKWGTKKRAVVYYVSAWYGVDYYKCKNYLMNATFWYYRFADKSWFNQNTRPYCWDEGGIGYLYILYEHNHDFQLLYDLLNQNAGEHYGEVLGSYIYSAFKDHPRGVIHTAQISKTGYRNVVELINNGGAWMPYSSGPTGNEEKNFFIYCQRVADDTRDPLRKVAQNLLRDTRKKH